MGACFCTGSCRTGGGCGNQPRYAEHRPWWGVLPPYAPFDPFQPLTAKGVTNDHTTILPKDDPTTPRPSPLAGSWQCGGCGTIYSPYVNKCECQKRTATNSGNGLNLDGDR